MRKLEKEEIQTLLAHDMPTDFGKLDLIELVDLHRDLEIVRGELIKDCATEFEPSLLVEIGIVSTLIYMLEN